MNNKSKIALAAAATLVAGAAMAAIPASAHDASTSSASPSTHVAREMKNHATISATITGIPSSVTSSHQASHGAYFTVYALSSSATAVPSTEPTTGGHRIGLRSGAKGVDSVQSGSTLVAELGFHAVASSTTKYAVYPSDGSAASLVTVVSDASGKSTVTSSRPLTVAYSATVAAEHPAKADSDHKGRGHGKGGKQGNKGPRSKH